ncbi:MAG: TSUP family transporter [Alphaproteobacteria bacterium]
MSFLTTAAVLSAVPPTALLSGIFGMSGGMILMGVFTWLLPVAVAMILHGITQAGSNGYRAYLHRRHIYWPVLRGYVFGSAISVAIFSWIAYVPSPAVVFIALGTLPFIHRLFPKAAAVEITRPGAATASGVIVTAFQLLAGVSGPVLDIFYLKSPMTRHQVVATKAMTQTIGHVVKLGYFAIVAGFIGRLDGTLPWWVFGAVIPLAFLGTGMGSWVLHRLTDTQFRQITQWLVLGIGTVFLVRGVVLVLG